MNESRNLLFSMFLGSNHTLLVQDVALSLSRHVFLVSKSPLPWH